MDFLSVLLPWASLIAPALAALVAVIGLAITHKLTSQRDVNNEKRKIRTNFMIEAYRKLENGSSRGADQEKYSDQFHAAIADVQLLGSPSQVEIARKIATTMGRGSGEPVSINELLNALRSELRSELGLPAVGTELVILRSPEQLGNGKS